jgi:murein L,D-transpeptidase YcbB/YkuD
MIFWYTGVVMNEYKFQFFTIVLLLILSGGVYWAISNLDYGTPDQEDIVQNDQILVENDQDVVIPIRTPDQEESIEEEDETPEPVSDDAELTDAEKELRDALERLIEDNIYMKKGSRGTRVGTVQKFLNWYFDTNIAVDNEYGPGTMGNVRKFQEAEGITADGLAGPGTYTKMIEVIEG